MRTITMRKGGRTMVNTTVRIESIEIKNFKNVGYGHLDFEDSKKAARQASSDYMGKTAPARQL